MELSCTTIVQVPGKAVVVELFELRTMLGVTTPANPGGKNVKLQVAGGVCVDTGLIMESVVVFSGAHPKEKLVGLLTINVGKDCMEVTFTVLVDAQPLMLLVNTTV